MVKFLLIGIGNSGRADDGLGWLFLDEIEKKYPGMFATEYRYQLQVEDAELIRNYDSVLFIDATQEKIPDGCALRPCESSGCFFYSSHLQSPEAIVYLAEELYGQAPDANTLHICGYDWELGNRPSEKALQNLNRALNLFHDTYFENDTHATTKHKSEPVTL
jgi:hydrogenase maturation protease